MSSTSKIPVQLEAYLDLPPESSLTLFTSILGATTNWLVLRFLYQNLIPTSSTSESTVVLLVSFLRNAEFWQESAKRIGLDLLRLEQNKQFSFLDGLSGLFSEGVVNKTISPKTLCNPDLKHVAEDIHGALEAIRGENKKVLLVIDGLDLLLATVDNITPVVLEEMIVDLREDIHAMVLTISADLPLVANLQSPLEINHANFLLSMAHQSSLIMSLRTLDTGTAKDVSGVLRIRCSDLDVRQRKVENIELLYFIGGDSSIRLFERGQ